ncbi:hypothetical protein DSUL_50014 [Desulfovibrionales bacterium]
MRTKNNKKCFFGHPCLLSPLPIKPPGHLFSLSTHYVTINDQIARLSL